MYYMIVSVTLLFSLYAFIRHTNVYIYIYIYVYICVCVCMYVCMYYLVQLNRSWE